MLNQKPLSGELIDYGSGLADGLVGCWMLNEGSGNEIYDLSGNRNELTFVNSPIWTFGNFGPAIHFTQISSQYIYKDSAPVTSAPLTMVGWFNADDGDTNGAIMWLGDKDTEKDYWVLYAGGGTAGDPVKAVVRMAAGGDTQNVLTTTTGFTVGKWHQAALVCESDTIRRIYIDAGSVGNGDSVEISPTGANRVGSGGWLDSSPGNYFNGKIGLLLLYNRALSLSEIALLYYYSFCFVGRRRRIIYDEIAGAAGLGIPIVAHHRKLLEAA